MIKETSAGVVIFRRRRGRNAYLLLHYPSGHWDFVKGRMEDGETRKETALRETREETGISDVSFVDGFEEWIRYEFQNPRGTVRKRVVFYLAETRARRVRISHEHLEFAWLDYDAAVKRATFENARTILKKAHKLCGGQPSGGRGRVARAKNGSSHD